VVEVVVVEVEVVEEEVVVVVEEEEEGFIYRWRSFICNQNPTATRLHRLTNDARCGVIRSVRQPEANRCWSRNGNCSVTDGESLGG
jgi:hypothetical protein